MSVWAWLAGLFRRAGSTPQPPAGPARPIPPAQPPDAATAKPGRPAVPVLAVGDDALPWLTVAAIRQIAPKADAEAWLGPLRQAMVRFAINTPRRAAHFFGQICHESQGLTVIEESLFYSTPGRLKAVFGSAYFPTVESEEPYRRNPQAVAAKVYDGRRDLGNTNPGDGWKFRGGGAIQTTGRWNFAALAAALGLPGPEAAAEYVRTRDGAAMSAAFYFSSKGLSELADRGGVEMVEPITRRVNTKALGLADRQAYFARAKAAFGA